MIPSTYLIPEPTYCSADCSPGHFVPSDAQFNLFVESIFQHWDQRMKLTKTIPTLTDLQYDDILSKNIVFLNLLDAAAVNTVAECIARSVPILINRNCGLRDILPDSYPLYYDTVDEAAKLAADMDVIMDAHHYLLHMDKTHLQIDSFMSEFINFLQCLAV
jgi:hypothetical protein